MKKIYMQPELVVQKIQGTQLMTTSPMNVNSDSDEQIGKGDVLAKGHDDSEWDEDEEDELLNPKGWGAGLW